MSRKVHIKSNPLAQDRSGSLASARAAGLLEVLNRLSAENITLDAYLASVLKFISRILDTSCTVMWMEQDGTMKPTRSVSRKDFEKRILFQEQHAALLSAAFQKHGSVVTSSQSSDIKSNNSSQQEDWVCLAIAVGNTTIPRAIIEIVFHSNTKSSPLKDKAFILNSIGKSVQARLLREESDILRDAIGTFRDYDKYASEIHRSLDLQEVVSTITTQLRSCLNASRVSIAVIQASRLKIHGVSGIDTLEHHSALVHEMERLAEAVHAQDEPIWYEESVKDCEWPPQVEMCVRSYLDISPTRTLIAMPLSTQDFGNENARTGEIEGVVIIEFFDGFALDNRIRTKVGYLSAHSSLALANAKEHNSVFLLPFSKGIHRLNSKAFFRQVTFKAVLLTLLGVLLFCIASLPVTFSIPVQGTVNPTIRRDLFAECEGIVTQVYVDHGDQVKKGDLLASITSLDLELHLTDLNGRKEAVVKELKALRHMMVDSSLSHTERDSIANRFSQQEETLQTIETQALLTEKRLMRCQIKCPLDGRITTWNANETLTGRPVTTGDQLFSVAALGGCWEVKLDIEEHDIGHVIQAWNSHSKPLKVTFALLSSPGMQYGGSLSHIDARTQVSDQGVCTVSAIALPTDSFTACASESSVMATIECGTCSLAYSYLHNFVDYVYSRILYWC